MINGQESLEIKVTSLPSQLLVSSLGYLAPQPVILLYDLEHINDLLRASISLLITWK